MIKKGHERKSYSKEYIVVRAKDKNTKPKCHVYFLIRDNRITYVGKTTNICARFLDHFYHKQFDRIFTIEVRKEELNTIEKHYINKFEPVDNLIINCKNYRIRRLHEKNHSRD